MEKQRKLVQIKQRILVSIVFALAFTMTASMSVSAKSKNTITLADIPEYSGYASVEVNDNTPFFTDKEKANTKAFESYTKLDKLKRCGVAYANVCPDLQPTEKRGEIGSVKPSGWQTVKYNDIIEGNYLYNRCHLIGYQLAGENANKKNLITGTRYMNVDGMLPYENMVDDYVDSTKNHVLYRVTPMFDGDNLVASGVLMEGYSVEDKGSGISFCVFCYNVQPGIRIDYATGKSTTDSSVISYDSTTSKIENSKAPKTSTGAYIVNHKNGTVHKSTCSHLPAEGNRDYYDSLSAADAGSKTKKHCSYCLK